MIKSFRYNTSHTSVKFWACVFLLGFAPSRAMAGASAQNEPAGGTVQAPFINQIVFRGANSISEDELKKQMKTREPAFFAIFTKPRLNVETLNRDLAQLEGYYHSTGFFEATVVLSRFEYSDDRRFVDVVIEVREGRPTRVESIEFSPHTLVDHKELRKGLLLKPGEPYNASLLSTDVYTIKSKYFDRGYLAVSVSDTVLLRDYRARIVYRIDPGTPISIRRIQISGNALSKNSVIEKEFAFKKGEICKLGQLVETQRNLFETGLFTVVDIVPENLDPMDRFVDVSVRVRERKAAYVEVGFGVGNILGSRIFGEWGTRNLFGTGRTLRFKSEYAYDLFKNDEIDFSQIQFKNKYYRYDTEFHQRHVLGTKLLMSVNTFLEKDATVEEVEVKTLGAGVTSARRLSPHTNLLVGLSHERIRRFVSDQPEERSTSRIATTGITYDKRDFILNPRRGSYQNLRLQGAGGFLGGDNDFYTIGTSVQRYYPLGLGVVLAARVRLGYADAFGDSKKDGVPIENRYFAGGGSSVRGYEENSLGPRKTGDPNGVTGEILPLGGRVLALTNVELRHSIPLLSRVNISGAVFVDGGNVWGSLQSVKLRDFRITAARDDVTIHDYRYGVGIGLRYNTPVGPIRLDYGLPIKLDNRTSARGRFHISLGQIF